jgi:hypothetical protein
MEHEKRWAELLAPYQLHDLDDLCQRLNLACPEAFSEASVLSWAYRLSREPMGGELPTGHVRWELSPSTRPMHVTTHVEGCGERWTHDVAAPCNAETIEAVFAQYRHDTPRLAQWVAAVDGETRTDLFLYMSEDVNEARLCFANASRIQHSQRLVEAFREAICLGRAQDTMDVLGVGVSKRLRDQDGNTPLHWAARHGHGQVAQVLLLAGFHPSKTNDVGQRPVEVAQLHGHHHLEGVLTPAGTREVVVGLPVRGRHEHSL